MEEIMNKKETKFGVYGHNAKEIIKIGSRTECQNFITNMAIKERKNFELVKVLVQYSVEDK